MINQSKLVVNKELLPLMDILYHWYGKEDLLEDIVATRMNKQTDGHVHQEYVHMF